MIFVVIAVVIDCTEALQISACYEVLNALVRMVFLWDLWCLRATLYKQQFTVLPPFFLFLELHACFAFQLHK